MTLAERLNWLYDETDCTHDEIERRTESAGRRVSAGYQSKLRSGPKQNPSYLVIGALARAFGIPAVFFYDEIDEQYLMEMKVVLAASRRAAASILLRSLDLSDEERRRTAGFVTQTPSRAVPSQL